MTKELRRPDDLPELARLSERIGSDPLLIQAAGGNTSVKDGDVMWIKASGTMLAEAQAKDIFVPVDLPAMCRALDDPSTDADQTAQFNLTDGALRPSIETSLHAVFSHRVVVHVHCVNALAHMVCKDGSALVSAKLTGFDWCLVPYAKPGANLAALVRASLGPKTNVAMLGNHGIIVAGETVAEAEKVLDDVVAALTVAPAAFGSVDTGALERIAAPGWRVPEAGAAMHQLALDPERMRLASGGSLYPDHVIFCGIGVNLSDGHLPDLADAPVFLLIPGKGAVVRADASLSAEALMNCLGDVLLRVPPGAELNYLTLEQNGELLNWDAEKYRQALSV